MLKLGKLFVYNITEKQNQFLLARARFAKEYAMKLGISEPENMSLNQIMEMRKLDGWKNPVLKEEE